MSNELVALKTKVEGLLGQKITEEDVKQVKRELEAVHISISSFLEEGQYTSDDEIERIFLRNRFDQAIEYALYDQVYASAYFIADGFFHIEQK